MKKIFLLCIITIITLFSYGQQDKDTAAILDKFTLFGDFVGVENVRIYFYEADTINDEWVYTHSISYFKSYEFSLDTYKSWVVLFEKDKINKSFIILAEKGKREKLDINFSLNIGKSFTIYYVPEMDYYSISETVLTKN